MLLPDRLYREAFEQARLPSILLDSRGMAALWNDAFDELFRSIAGFPPERLRAPLFEWLQEREGFQFSYYVSSILAGRQTAATVEAPVAGAAGERRWIRLRLSRVNATGEVDRRGERWVFAVAEDVTEQKLREKRLETEKAEAEKATRTKSLFLANMSHEIRTPIQTILGMAELLKSTGLDKEQADYVRTVGFAADILLGLINDVLDFSKIEAGRLDMETLDFDLRSTIRQAVNLLSLDAHKKGLELVVELDEAMPGIVRGDPSRLRQVIVNLIKNAVKFTRAGEVLVLLERVDRAGGSRARISVEDSGDGVPESLRGDLFTPFTQAVAAANNGGTGLGLAISRHLVELMGGEIGYRPRESGGSVFWFEVPLVEALFAVPMPSLRSGTPARVLVVDDHALARRQTERRLAGFGHRTDTAASGAEALAALRAAVEDGEPYALAVVDQDMPDMDGWRLANEVTGDAAIASTRLVLATPAGLNGPEAKMRLLRWFQAYVVKPIRPTELFEATEKALSMEETLEPLEEGPGASQSAPPRFGKTVLVAEDHAVNQELFAALLEQLGCEAMLAGDGVEAVEAARGRTPDLVLMDIFMPRMNGYDAARELRASGFHGPIIAVTASAMQDERDKCLAVGMNDVLTKPFRRADLETMLGFWFARERGKDRENAAPPARSAVPGPAAFDAASLVETFLGKADTVANLLRRFLEKTPAQLDALDAAATSGELKELREIAHSIKGAAWNLTGKRLGDAAAAVEKPAKEGDLGGAAGALGALREAWKEFGEAVGLWLETFGPA
ncbi:MAG TPA: response regulator [Spirochaetales bacterium]|nr:response regulator [Spirochaetales bacterium]